MNKKIKIELSKIIEKLNILENEIKKLTHYNEILQFKNKLNGDKFIVDLKVEPTMPLSSPLIYMINNNQQLAYLFAKYLSEDGKDILETKVCNFILPYQHFCKNMDFIEIYESQELLKVYRIDIKNRKAVEVDIEYYKEKYKEDKQKCE